MSRDTQLLIDLVRVETRLYNLLDERLRAAHGVTLGQYQIMQVLARDGASRVLDLAQEIDITVGAMSKAVDRFEAAGWGRRAANPGDRRSSLITLTAAGARVLPAVTTTVADELEARLHGVVPQDALDVVARTLAAVRIALEGNRTGRSG